MEKIMLVGSKGIMVLMQTIVANAALERSEEKTGD
jgi:hypothetical protein